MVRLEGERGCHFDTVVLHDAEDLVDTVDRERMLFIKHYFGADWPTRSLYHLMINTAIGDENVIATVLRTMSSLHESPVLHQP